MKKLISFIVFFLVINISAVPNAFALDYTDASYAKGYEYTVVNDSEIWIYQYEGKAKHLIIPSSIEGLPVTEFGLLYPDEDNDLTLQGIRGNKRIVSIVFPGTIKRIGWGAVQDCKNLEKVVVKGNVKEIEVGTFRNCPKLTKIDLPDSVTTIEEQAFTGTGLRKFEIGKNVKKFSPAAVMNSKVSKITVKKRNKHYSSYKGVLYNKDKSTLCCYPSGKKTKSFTTPQKTKTIDTEAFSLGNKLIEKVVLSKGIEKVKGNAFRSCVKLTKVKFNTKKDLKVEPCAFFDCTSLRNIMIPENVVKIGNSAFGYFLKDYKVKRIKGFTIKGYKGTAAEKYAKKNGFKFVALD